MPRRTTAAVTAPVLLAAGCSTDGGDGSPGTDPTQVVGAADDAGA